jgi:hypothetical protein
MDVLPEISFSQMFAAKSGTVDEWLPNVVRLAETVKDVLQPDPSALNEADNFEQESQQRLEAALAQMPNKEDLEAAYKALLTFCDQTLVTLVKTWCLARAEGLRSQWLASSLAKSEADLGKLLSERAFLASTDADKSDGTKMVPKQRIRELANAHKKIEQSMLSMEKGRQSEVWSRAESDRLLLGLKAAARLVGGASVAADEHGDRLVRSALMDEAETILASEQRNEFRRRLSQAKEALHQGQEVLADAKDQVQCAQHRPRETRAAWAQNQLRVRSGRTVPLPGDESGGGSLPFAGTDRSTSDKNPQLSSRRPSGSCQGVRRNSSIAGAKASQTPTRATSMSAVVDAGTKPEPGDAALPALRLGTVGRVRRTAEKFGGVARSPRVVGRLANNSKADRANAIAGSAPLSTRTMQVDSSSPRMRSASQKPLRNQRSVN